MCKIHQQKEMYLSEREGEAVTVAICKKKMTGWGSEWRDGKGVLGNRVAKIKRLMLERQGQAAQTHCNKAADRLISMTTDSPAFMLPVKRNVFYE